MAQGDQSPDRPKAPQADKTPDTRQRIFDAAVHLFAKKGFAATGVRELVREADVNLATVNYFFGSKKGLLRAILDDFFNTFLDGVEKTLSGEEDPMVRLRRTIQALARYFAAEREKMLIVITELPHDDPDIIDVKAEFVRRIVSIFETHFLGPLEEATGARPPLAVIGPAMTSLVASQFLFRPVIEKVQPAGFGATSPEQYPELIAELYINGLNGVLERMNPKE